VFGTLTYRGALGEILYLELFYTDKIAKNLAYNGGVELSFMIKLIQQTKR